MAAVSFCKIYYNTRSIYTRVYSTHSVKLSKILNNRFFMNEYLYLICLAATGSSVQYNLLSITRAH